MLDPGAEELDIKKEMIDVPPSVTTSSSCTCKCEDSLGYNLKTEDLTAGCFESYPGHYDKTNVTETKDTAATMNSDLPLVKTEPEDCKPFRCDFCQNLEAGSSCSEGQILQSKMNITESEPSGSAADSRSVEGVPGTQRDEKPHKCELCDYSCKQRGTLKDHMRTHTGEKPFKCELCDSSFSQGGNVNFVTLDVVGVGI